MSALLKRNVFAGSASASASASAASVLRVGTRRSGGGVGVESWRNLASKTQMRWMTREIDDARDGEFIFYKPTKSRLQCLETT